MGKSHVQCMIKEMGKKAVGERISSYISDILKAAPSSVEIDSAISFLMQLRTDIIEGKLSVE